MQSKRPPILLFSSWRAFHFSCSSPPPSSSAAAAMPWSTTPLRLKIIYKNVQIIIAFFGECRAILIIIFRRLVPHTVHHAGRMPYFRFERLNITNSIRRNIVFVIVCSGKRNELCNSWGRNTRTFNMNARTITKLKMKRNLRVSRVFRERKTVDHY